MDAGGAIRACRDTDEKDLSNLMRLSNSFNIVNRAGQPLQIPQGLDALSWAGRNVDEGSCTAFKNSTAPYCSPSIWAASMIFPPTKWLIC